MATVETVTLPEIPEELWMLWDTKKKTFIRSIDDAAAGETFLVSLSEEEAFWAAEHQNDMYELNCIPVRVKGGPTP